MLCNAWRFRGPVLLMAFSANGAGFTLRELSNLFTQIQVVSDFGVESTIADCPDLLPAFFAALGKGC